MQNQIHPSIYPSICPSTICPILPLCFLHSSIYYMHSPISRNHPSLSCRSLSAFSIHLFKSLTYYTGPTRPVPPSLTRPSLSASPASPPTPSIHPRTTIQASMIHPLVIQSEPVVRLEYLRDKSINRLN